jgi:hypothetical protein
VEKTNDNMTTKEQAFEWLEQNKYILTTSIKFTPQQIKDFFSAYNLITGENKPVVGCGRCILNMKHRLLAELKKTVDMKKYPVYKTAKGTLTFKVYGEPLLYIRAATDTQAKAHLEILKKESKNV